MTVTKEAVRPARRHSSTRKADELAFLPAALEAVETPPSPTARWSAWVLTLLVLFALLWSWFGHLDVVVSSEGRTVASGRSKVVQAPEAGIVRAIHVRDGQSVRAGDVLLELDPTAAAAERDRLRHEIADARLTVARVQAALTAIIDGSSVEGWAVAADNRGLLSAHQSLLRGEVAEHRARLATLAEDAARKRAEAATVRAMITRLDETVPLIAARTEARGDLARSGVGSRLVWLEARQQLAEAEHEREVQRRRLDETEAGLSSLAAQIVAARAEFERARSAERTEAERRLGTLVEALAAAERRLEMLRLVAPVDGVAQQLAVHTVGGVVQAAEHLLVIAPAEDGLEFEAQVLNRDRGFLREGQRAAVKLEAYPFTRYGLVPAELVWISGDAIPDERRGPVFAARLRLLTDSLERGGVRYQLAPGLVGAAEIHTDRRRVIDYLLSPIERVSREAMREP